MRQSRLFCGNSRVAKLTGLVAVGFLLGGIALGMQSIAGKPDSLEEYLRVLEKNESGLERSRVFDGIEYSVRYIPPELLAYREMRKVRRYERTNYDSLCVMFDGTVAFELSFKMMPPFERNDVIWKNISSQEEYSDRLKMLSFDMQEMIGLSADGKMFYPELAIMENVYTMGADRRIMILFSDETLSEILQGDADIRFEYYDQVFGSGQHYFNFANSALTDCPELSFDVLAAQRSGPFSDSIE